MMIDREILEAFQKAVPIALAASTTPTLPVKYLGVTFEVPNDQRYLECVFIPNNEANMFWGNEKIYQGAFRLLLHWNIDGMGYYPPMNALASIAQYFNKSRVLERDGVRVQIYNDADFGPVLEQPPELIFPATITYRTLQL